MTARFLRHWRAYRGWSQPALAARAGVHPITISDIERGRRAQLATLVKLAKALSTDGLVTVQALRVVNPLADPPAATPAPTVPANVVA
jgi:transcriptional regulator with XRE-family HTH domain